MPFLRFTRDKRGYENTFVLHAGAGRGRKRTSVLYWFRTPPGVRVGRAALDEEAIRSIEDAHPEIHFDWTAILENRAVVEAPAERDRVARSERKRERRRSPETPSPAPRIEDAGDRAFDGSESAAGRRNGQEPSRADSSSTDASLAVEREFDEGRRPGSFERHPALEDLVGSEGVARLRARFAELRARIAEQPDADALRAEAEPLNPDTWVTVEEARHGLEHFEAAFEAMRRRLPAAPRRRRRGRRSKTPDAATSSVAGAISESGVEEASREDEDRRSRRDV